MRAPWVARQLQRPIDDMLRIIASGEREDPPSRPMQPDDPFRSPHKLYILSGRCVSGRAGVATFKKSAVET